jgi:hypothetical protein
LLHRVRCLLPTLGNPTATPTSTAFTRLLAHLYRCNHRFVFVGGFAAVLIGVSHLPSHIDTLEIAYANGALIPRHPDSQDLKQQSSPRTSVTVTTPTARDMRRPTEEDITSTLKQDHPQP